MSGLAIVIVSYNAKSHLLACLLKAELGPDRRWQAFLRHCSRARVRLAQTAGHFLTPPAWRTKARYRNVAKYVRRARRRSEPSWLYHSSPEAGPYSYPILGA